MATAHRKAKEKENIRTSAAMSGGEGKAPVGQGKDWQKRAEMLQQQLRLAREKTEKRKPHPSTRFTPNLVASNTCPTPTSALGGIGDAPSKTFRPVESANAATANAAVPPVSSAAARSSATTERMLQMVHTLRQKIKTGAPLRDSRRLKDAAAPPVAASSNDGNDDNSAVRADTHAPDDGVAQHPVAPGARIGFARAGARSRLLSAGGASTQDRTAELLLSTRGDVAGHTAAPFSMARPSAMESGTAQLSPVQPHISARLRNPHAPPAPEDSAGSAGPEERPSAAPPAFSKERNSTVIPAATGDAPATAAPLDLNDEDPEPYQVASCTPHAISTATAEGEMQKAKVETVSPYQDARSSPQDELMDRECGLNESATVCATEKTETPLATECCASPVPVTVETKTVVWEDGGMPEASPFEDDNPMMFNPVNSPGVTLSADDDARLLVSNHTSASMEDGAEWTERCTKQDLETPAETTNATPADDHGEVATDIFNGPNLDASTSEEAAAIVAAAVDDQSGPAWRIPMAPQVVVHGFQRGVEDSAPGAATPLEVVQPELEGGDTACQEARTLMSSMEPAVPPTLESLRLSVAEAAKAAPDANTEDDAPLVEEMIKHEPVDSVISSMHDGTSPVLMETQVTPPATPEVTALAKASVGEEGDVQSCVGMGGEYGAGEQGSSADTTRATSPPQGVVGEQDARQVTNSDGESSLAESQLCPPHMSSSVQVSINKVPLNPETPETALRTERALRSSAEECIASIDATDDVLLFNVDSPFPAAPEFSSGAADCCKGSPVVLDSAVAEEVANKFLSVGDLVGDSHCQDPERQMEQDSCDSKCHSPTPDVELHGEDSRLKVGVSLSLKLGWSSSSALQPQTTESNIQAGITSSQGPPPASPPSPPLTALFVAPEARQRVMFDMNTSPASFEEEDMLEEEGGIDNGRMPPAASSKPAPCVEVVSRTAQDESIVRVQTATFDQQHLVPLEAVVAPEVVAKVMQEEPLGQLENYFKHEGVVLYTTSMRTIRQTYDNCEKIRALFQILGVDYEDRDVSMSTEWRDELESRLGGRQMLPRIFVNGTYLGGHKEVEHLAENYTLQDMLKQAGRVPCLV